MKQLKDGCQSRKKIVIFYGVVLAFVLIAGFVMELFCGLPAVSRRRNSPDQTGLIPMETITYEGFHEENGQLIFDGESGRIRIPLKGQYVDKFSYSYNYDGLLNLMARVGAYNEYGELRERDIVTMEDRNSKVLHNSYLKIGARADYVELYVSREGLFEQGLSYLDYDSMKLSFAGFKTVDSVGINIYRLCFFWCVFGIGAFLFWGRDILGRRMEIGFLVISISVGTLMSLSLPANKVSWDEEVHFAQSLWLANYKNPLQVSPTVFQEFSAGVDTWPYNQPGTMEEQQEFDNYLDSSGDYKNGEILWSTDLNKNTVTGYVGQALFLKTGQILHLPFSDLFKLGRLGNLFVYCIIMYLAIKKTPVGKGIMAFLGLMPEPMMLAGVYSYDPTVTAFMYLAFAYLLWAILTPDQKLGVKEYGVMLLAFFWGCRIKAVYAPLILMGLLIPAERFRSQKERKLMKCGFLLLFVLLMASFVLPVLIAPSATGDIRGDSTSEVGQMAYVLGQPFTYGRILIKNIWNTLPSYVIGEKSLGLMGHQGAFPYTWLIYVSSVAVILTGGQSSCGKRLSGKQKLWIFLLASVTVALVWTSMYIAFTTPGNTYIDGVQGRYYMPFLFLVWLVLNPQRLTVHLKNGDYYSLVLGLGSTILLTAYYTNVLSMFCL